MFAVYTLKLDAGDTYVGCCESRNLSAELEAFRSATRTHPTSVYVSNVTFVSARDVPSVYAEQARDMK